MSEMTEVNKQKLIADLKVVVADAEEILKATAVSYTHLTLPTSDLV